MLKILVVEDEFHLRTLIVKHLEKAGYELSSAVNGEEGLALFEESHFDLIITDVMMPKVNGLQMVKEIRTFNEDIPVIMLTALGTFNDKEKGFDSGADDYIVKPIDMKELQLKIKGLMRRYKAVLSNVFTHKTVVLNSADYQCQIKGKNVELANKEFQLLFKLVTNPGRIFTREQLMNEIWGYDSYSYERTVDTHVKRIREKVKTNDLELVTVRGLGYKAVLK